MTKEQINELLANMISTYSSQFGKAIAQKAASKLATSTVEGRIEKINGSAYALAKNAFSACGTILEENMADGVIAGVILSGAASMNPAFVLLWIEGDTIHMEASAKEGLIKQHTAEKAIEKFKSAFSEIEGR